VAVTGADAANSTWHPTKLQRRALSKGVARRFLLTYQLRRAVRVQSAATPKSSGLGTPDLRTAGWPHRSPGPIRRTSTALAIAGASLPGAAPWPCRTGCVTAAEADRRGGSAGPLQLQRVGERSDNAPILPPRSDPLSHGFCTGPSFRWQRLTKQ